MEIMQFIKDFPVREFRKGDILLHEGQQSDALLALRTGFVKVTSLHENGSEKLLWIAGRYDVAPTEQLFSTQGNLRYFYTALTNGSLYEIKKTHFLEHASSNPLLMGEIAAGMSGHYDDLMNRLDSVEQTSIRGKLIFTLRYLGERFSANNSVDLFELGLKLTQSDLAAMVGSTRETISVELNLLKADGAITYDRTKFMLDIEKLRLLND